MKLTVWSVHSGSSFRGMGVRPLRASIEIFLTYEGDLCSYVVSLTSFLIVSRKVVDMPGIRLGNMLLMLRKATSF